MRTSFNRKVIKAFLDMNTCSFFKSLLDNSLALLSGVLFTLAFAPFNYLICLFIAISLFKRELDKINSGKGALLRGFFFGLGIFGSGTSWVYVSMTLNTEGIQFIPIVMTVIFCSFWAFNYALFSYLYVKVKRNKWFDVVHFVLLWVLVEYIRGEWVLNGFPWLQVAYSQLDSFLAGYIPVLGVYGVGLITVFFACLCLELVQKKQIRFFLFISVLFFVGTYLKTINWVHRVGEELQVTLIQGNISQENKWQPENRKRTLKLYATETAKHWDSDLIIWPETAIPAYYKDVKTSYLAPLQQEAIKQGTDIIVSLPYKNKQGDLYNTALVLGSLPAMYKKIHLLPFGEYLPWQPLSGYLLSLVDVRLGLFTAGELTQPLLQIAGHPIVTSICYEDAFGEQNRQQVNKAHFLVNLTNDGWFDGSIEPYQHLQIARMRALESGRYLLRATNTGVTAIISEKGKVIKQAPIGKKTVITAKIFPMTGLTPYALVGDSQILWVVILLYLLYQFVSKNYAL